MPFEKELQEVYESGIKETLKNLGWECHRSDEKFDAPEIVCTICKNAQEASLILADLTGRNPNVFLEVGLAFGLEKHVVFLSQNPKDIPFDAKTFRTIMYDPHKLLDLKRKLRTLVKSIKVPSRLPKLSLFESRCAKLKRVAGVPSKPLAELFIGPISETKEWLPTRARENLDLMRCLYDPLRIKTVVPRRKHFEFESRSPEIFARMYSDGFFHCVFPWLEVDPEAKTYHLYWIVSDVAELLYFVVRMMKLKGVKTEQTLRLDLHGISGRQVFPFSRESAFWLSRRTWSFSKDQDSISYQKRFNPQEKFVSLFNLLREVYKDFCIDLGVTGIKDEIVAQSVKEIVGSMRSLRTTYSGRGLERLSLEEIFDETSN